MGKDGAGVSRRELLKKSALAGGAVWVAPVILASSAGATGSSCPKGSCPTYHRVKFDNNEQPVANATNTGVECGAFVDLSGGGQCPLPAPAGTIVATTCAQFNSHVLVVDDIAPGNSITITLKPGYQFVAGFSKKGGPVGGQHCPGSQGGPASISSNCRTATFGPNSHIEFLYCGPN